MAAFVARHLLRVVTQTEVWKQGEENPQWSRGKEEEEEVVVVVVVVEREREQREKGRE